jgi:hypothetical protein
VRHPIPKRKPVTDNDQAPDGPHAESGPPVLDPRLLCYEPEFAAVFKVLEQPRNLLPTLLRQAWDTGQLRTPVKNGQAQTRDAHISLLGHLTTDELRSVPWASARTARP